MVINRLIWSAMFISFSHPCAVADVPADGMLGVGVDMLPGVEIIVMATPAINLEFVVGGAYADVLAVAIFDVVSAIDVVDVLTDENVNGLAAVMTPLEFTLSAP